MSCYCHNCKKSFKSLGIARHRAMHRDKREDCKISFTNGEIGTYEYSKLKTEFFNPQPKKGQTRLKGAAYTKLKKDVFRRDFLRCRNPKCKSPKNLTIHHKPKISLGGQDIPENMFTICIDCHRAIEDGRLKDDFLRPPTGKSG